MISDSFAEISSISSPFFSRVVSRVEIPFLRRIRKYTVRGSGGRRTFKRPGRGKGGKKKKEEENLRIQQRKALVVKILAGQVPRWDPTCTSLTR